LLEKLLLRGAKFIVDYDDNINARYQTGFSKIFLSKKILNIGKLANAITVGNHWYMDFYKDIDPTKIHYLPTVIDRDLYAATKIVKQNNEPLTIVWIGSPSTIKYLKSIDDVLVKLQLQYNFKLKAIGANIQLNCATEFVEWNAVTEIAVLKQSDIGIMPLQDTDWEKGKCGFKLVQYMACGLPVVASYSVANNEIIEPGCGFIAKTNDEWFDLLSQLLQSAALRNQLGENGKTRVYNHYSYQVWAPVFVKIVTNIGYSK
jgi:glycosyltransferase involved in cell wall biosynthesis